MRVPSLGSGQAFARSSRACGVRPWIYLLATYIAYGSWWCFVQRRCEPRLGSGDLKGLTSYFPLLGARSPRHRPRRWHPAGERSTPLPAGASWRRFPSEENTSVRSDSTLSPLQGMHKS